MTVHKLVDTRGHRLLPQLVEVVVVAVAVVEVVVVVVLVHNTLVDMLAHMMLDKEPHMLLEFF